MFRAADVNVASPPAHSEVDPSSSSSTANGDGGQQQQQSGSNKLLSLLKAKKERGKDKDEVASPTGTQPTAALSLSTSTAANSPPSSSPPQPSSSSSSPTSASSASAAAASSDALAKLAFWKKKSSGSATTPKGFRSASFNNLTAAEGLQNTSSMAFAAATGKGSKAGGAADRQLEGDETREPTSASSPTKSAKHSPPPPASPPSVSLSATPPASSPSLPVSPQPQLSPSLDSSVTNASNELNSASASTSVLPAYSSFSLSSLLASDAVAPAAASSAASSSSMTSPAASGAKTSSSYYSTSSYYSSMGGSTSLAAFRQSIAMAKSPSFSSTAADSSTVSVTAPSSPRNSTTSESKAAATAVESSSQSASAGTSLSTSPVTSPITSPRRMPRASSLDTTLQSLSSALQSASLAGKDAHSSNLNKKTSNLLKLLQDDALSLDALRRLAWSGVPTGLRSVAWKLLLEYLPVQRKRRDAVLENRRNEYHSYLDDYDRACSQNNKSEDELAMLRQIRADIPRTTPGIGFFKRPDVAQSLERALYVFALRHPASGYVQGMNDLITPFYAVFVYDWQPVDITNNSLTAVDVLELEDDKLLSLEADCYWCLSKLLDGIQDNYTFAQPGIQRAIYRMREIVERVDAALVKHLDANHVQLLHFAFRWMNCLLMRELSTALIVRLWDSYLADDRQSGFKTFHLYVCVALLVSFSKDVKQLEGGELIVFLQRLPTEGWREKDVDTLIAQAFLYRSWFDDAPRHLK